MTALLARLLGCALISMALLELVKGPMREILRLGCGALMILALFSLIFQVLPRLELSFPNPGAVGDLQQQTQARMLEDQRQAVSRALSDYIAKQGSAAGAVCTGRVVFVQGPDGLDRIERLEIDWYSGSASAKSALLRSLSHDFSLPQDKIIIKEMVK